MYAGEMAEFVMPFSEYNEKNRDMPMFYGVNWVRYCLIYYVSESIDPLYINH